MVTYWRAGAIIDSEVLGEERAEHGAQILLMLSRELTARYGKGVDRPSLSRMVKSISIGLCLGWSLLVVIGIC